MIPLLAAANSFGSLLPFVLMIGVVWFMLIAPMKKQERERKDRLQNLNKGDKVVVGGGLLGRVSNVQDEIVVVELADKVKVRVLKSKIEDMEEDAIKNERERGKPQRGGGLFGGGRNKEAASDDGDKGKEKSSK